MKDVVITEKPPPVTRHKYAVSRLAHWRTPCCKALIAFVSHPSFSRSAIDGGSSPQRLIGDSVPWENGSDEWNLLRMDLHHAPESRRLGKTDFEALRKIL
jgi:hypothetical protein